MKTIHTDLQTLAPSSYRICVARKQAQQFTFPQVFKVTKLTDTLNETQPLVSEKCKFVFQDKSDPIFR